jgi:hypothetical protein
MSNSRDRVFAREVFDVATGQLWRRRCGWIQLEGAPGELDLGSVRESGKGGLEATLSYVAPGTDHVGPDIDFHDCFNA